MTDDFDLILDNCIDRLNRGESMESVLSDYPQYAQQLAPLLQVMHNTQRAYHFTPSVDNKRESRVRFYAALDQRRKSSFWKRLLSQPVAWAGMAVVLAVIVIIGVVGLKTTLPSQQPIYAVLPATPSPEGNFIFLVSDEVNAIDEFSELMVTIDKVSLQRSGGESSLVEFIPETREFDLSLLPGEKTRELWRGNLPEGEYTRVVVYVSNVYGTLKADQKTIDIKLPSNKLHISHSFTVSNEHITSFIYDLTVVHAGNANNGGKYLLKPQVGESGAIQKPVEDKPGKGKTDIEKTPGG